MSFEGKIHDAMRDMGIVPDAENFPLVACSTLYRESLFRALEGVDNGEDRIHELESELREQEIEIRHYREKSEKLSGELDDAIAERAALNQELAHAQKRLTKLENNTTGATL